MPFLWAMILFAEESNLTTVSGILAAVFMFLSATFGILWKMRQYENNAIKNATAEVYLELRESRKELRRKEKEVRHMYEDKCVENMDLVVANSELKSQLMIRDQEIAELKRKVQEHK